MTKPKIIFFDIDGTLVPLKEGIRPRTVEALQKLRQNGIKLCIATGRAPMEVPKFEGVTFDAFLTYNGSYLCAGQNIGLLDLIIDDGGGIIGHLAAIRAVGLVAVVLGGVVGSGDHDTGIALVVTGGKAQGRHGHQGIIDAHLDAVGGQNTGGGLGKDIALQAAVVADGDSLAAALGLDPVCQALGGLTDNIDAEEYTGASVIPVHYF